MPLRAGSAGKALSSAAPCGKRNPNLARKSEGRLEAQLAAVLAKSIIAEAIHYGLKRWGGA
jgi:hypothetical protein